MIDYRGQDFEAELTGYDLVLDSLGGDNLEKSLRILRPGGKAIGIAGPPDPAFAREVGLPVPVRLAITGLSSKIRRRAKKLGVSYEFLLMRSSGDQLRKIATLVDDGVLRPLWAGPIRSTRRPTPSPRWPTAGSAEKSSSPFPDHRSFDEIDAVSRTCTVGSPAPTSNWLRRAGSSRPGCGSS